MSHQNFVSDLVAMAKAFEELPQAHARIHELERVHEIDLDTIQRLELRLIERNNEIETLHSTIRQLEVARDDAELRFLECDDAKSTLERVLRGVIGEAQGVLQAIAPLPVSAPEPMVVTGTPNVDSQTNIPIAGDPYQDTSMYGGAPAEVEVIVPRDTYQGVKSDDWHPSPFDPSPSVYADASSPDVTSEGQSAADPTVNSMTTVSSETAPIKSVETVDTVDGSTSAEGHRADPFPAETPLAEPGSALTESNVSTDGVSEIVSTDATTLVDSEPGKYIYNPLTWCNELNPAWISWFNRHGAPTGQ